MKHLGANRGAFADHWSELGGYHIDIYRLAILQSYQKCPPSKFALVLGVYLLVQLHELRLGLLLDLRHCHLVASPHHTGLHAGPGRYPQLLTGQTDQKANAAASAVVGGTYFERADKFHHLEFG
jgi:hypothetical protein